MVMVPKAIAMAMGVGSFQGMITGTDPGGGGGGECCLVTPFGFICQRLIGGEVPVENCIKLARNWRTKS